MHGIKHFSSLYEFFPIGKLGQVTNISDMPWQAIFYGIDSAVHDISPYVRC